MNETGRKLKFGEPTHDFFDEIEEIRKRLERITNIYCAEGIDECVNLWMFLVSINKAQNIICEDIGITIVGDVFEQVNEKGEISYNCEPIIIQ